MTCQHLYTNTARLKATDDGVRRGLETCAHCGAERDITIQPGHRGKVTMSDWRPDVTMDEHGSVYCDELEGRR